MVMPKIKKIKQFDRSELKRLDEEFDKHLEQIGKKFGIAIKRKGGSFSPTNFTFKVEASVIGEGGQVQTREAEDFKLHAWRYGLEPKDLNAHFLDFRGDEFEITGLATRRRKNPVMAKNIRTGKTFVWPVEEIKHLLKTKRVKA